jgi:hypothetical protein
MRKTREILRLKWLLERSHREIRQATGAGLGTISDTATRAAAARLDWAAVEQLGDDELEARLYPPMALARRPLPDPAHIHVELRRPGVTLRLLHEEYLGQHADGYGYTQFAGHYRTWAEAQRVTMRQVHRAGDKVFVDYSGKKPTIVDPTTGERVEVELFVAVLGASNYTYAEATRTQRSHDWIESRSPPPLTAAAHRRCSDLRYARTASDCLESSVDVTILATCSTSSPGSASLRARASNRPPTWR